MVLVLSKTVSLSIQNLKATLQISMMNYNNQWRRQNFFRGEGGKPRPIKVTPPPDGSEIPFFKTMQSIRKWIHFSKISNFSCQKSIFSKKNFEKWAYFTGISEILKTILKISIFLEKPYKSREIPDEFYYLVEKFIKKLKNGLNREWLLKVEGKFLKFLEKLDWNL